MQGFSYSYDCPDSYCSMNYIIAKNEKQAEEIILSKLKRWSRDDITLSISPCSLDEIYLNDLTAGDIIRLLNR